MGGSAGAWWVDGGIAASVAALVAVIVLYLLSQARSESEREMRERGG